MATLLAFLTACAISLLVCRVMLARWGTFRSEEVKEGKDRPGRVTLKRPLVGGLGVVAGLSVGLLVALLLGGQGLGLRDGVLLLLLTWGFGAVGLLDDVGKVRGRGLRERDKLIGQAALALLAGLALYQWRDGGAVFIPLLDREVNLGIAYILFAALVIISSANAVNLTDGVDGLAGSLLVVAGLTYGLLSPLHGSSAALPVGAALAGACVGFLAYNRPPARLLMGDTGALGAGAALGVLALVTRTEWLLVLIGGVFVVDTLSVIVQTGIVRLGRRVVQVLRHRTGEVFRPFFVAPIHHHFQWMGWPDEQVVLLFLGAGVAFSLSAGLSLWSSWFWAVGVVVMVGLLMWTALTKALRVYYFLGTGEDGERIWVYQGLPYAVLGRPLYEAQRETDLTLSDLTNLTSEALLWRTLGEFEVRLLLGKSYAERRKWDAALREWEAVPVRNLVLREQVVWELGRVYVARGDLIKAIQLWERLPRSKAEAIAGLRETLSDVKLRLISLARRAYQQSLRQAQSRARRQDITRAAREVRRDLEAAYQLNEQALELFDVERRRLPAVFSAVERKDYQSARTALARLERAVRSRLSRLDDALRRWGGPHPRLPGTPAALLTAPRDLAMRTRQACRELGITPEDFVRAVGMRDGQEPLVYELSVEPTPSRNRLFRLKVGWGEMEPIGVVVKQYEERRVRFSSACYRREYGILTLLERYGAPVAHALGGLDGVERSLLFLEDLGADTLSERLVGATPDERVVLMDLCLSALADLHRRANAHLSELSREIEKIRKEHLSPQYCRETLRIATQRVVRFQGRSDTDTVVTRLAEASRPVVEVLTQAPRSFVHYEFIPRNLLFHARGVRAVDFEQATLGPREMDYATLLKSPEADLSPSEVERLLTGDPAYAVEPLIFSAANVFKSLFYAGAAAHFDEKFADEEAQARCWWYIRDAARAAAGTPAWSALAEVLNELAEPPVGAAEADAPPVA